MSKNTQAMLYAMAVAGLGLLETQLGAHAYPLSEPQNSVAIGLVALLMAALTAVSPWVKLPPIK